MNWKVLSCLVIAYFVYLLLGAAIFSAIERPVEIEQCDNVMANVKEFRRIVKENRDNITVAHFANLTQVLQTALSFGIEIDENLNVTCSVNWDFQSAFFFSGTVVTTIGYGHIAPNTNLGRSMCILYALLGIPVFALMFSGLGDVISKQIKRLDERARGRARRSWVAKSVVILIVLGSFLVFCLLIPAAIFQAVEGWSYGDSLYYGFITLTTIGFGDFVAGTDPEITYIAIYRVMVYFWILFGMAFMATIITLISEFFKKTGKRAGKRKNSPMAEVDGVVPQEDEEEKDESIDNVQPKISNGSEKMSDPEKPQDDSSATTTDSNESLEKRPFDVEQDAGSKPAAVTP